MDCSSPRSPVHRIFQARMLQWVSISFSRGSSRPSVLIQVSCTAGRFFINWATREACKCTLIPPKIANHIQITWILNPFNYKIITHKEYIYREKWISKNINLKNLSQNKTPVTSNQKNKWNNMRSIKAPLVPPLSHHTPPLPKVNSMLTSMAMMTLHFFQSLFISICMF